MPPDLLQEYWVQLGQAAPLEEVLRKYTERGIISIENGMVSVNPEYLEDSEENFGNGMFDSEEVLLSNVEQVMENFGQQVWDQEALCNTLMPKLCTNAGIKAPESAQVAKILRQLQISDVNNLSKENVAEFMAQVAALNTKQSKNCDKMFSSQQALIENVESVLQLVGVTNNASDDNSLRNKIIPFLWEKAGIKNPDAQQIDKILQQLRYSEVTSFSKDQVAEIMEVIKEVQPKSTVRQGAILDSQAALRENVELIMNRLDLTNNQWTGENLRQQIIPLLCQKAGIQVPNPDEIRQILSQLQISDISPLRLEDVVEVMSQVRQENLAASGNKSDAYQHSVQKNVDSVLNELQMHHMIDKDDLQRQIIPQLCRKQGIKYPTNQELENMMASLGLQEQYLLSKDQLVKLMVKVVQNDSTQKDVKKKLDTKKQLEATLINLFTYVDNDPESYEKSIKYIESVKAYLDDPDVQKSMVTFEHFHLLMRYGEYLHSMSGKPESAVPYFEQAVELASILYPSLKGNDELALAHEWLGRCYIIASKLGKAELHFQKSLEVRYDLHGEDHEDIAVSWHCLGNVYASQKQMDKAVELHSKSLELKKKHLGEDDPQISYTLGMLAGDFIEMKEYQKALDMQQEAYDIRIKTYGKDHPRIADINFNMATTYIALKDVDNAEKNIMAAYAIRRKLFGEDHYTVALCKLNIAKVLGLKEDFAEAITYVNQAQDVLMKHLGPDHPHTGNCATLRQGLQNRQSKIESAAIREQKTQGKSSNSDNSPAKRSSCCVLF